MTSSKTRIIIWVVVVVGIVILWDIWLRNERHTPIKSWKDDPIILALFFPPKPEPPQPPRPVVKVKSPEYHSIGDKIYLKKGCLVASTPDILLKAIEIRQDKVAFQKIIETGNVSFSNLFKVVYIEDIDVWKCIARVRQEGELQSVYVELMAIEK